MKRNFSHLSIEDRHSIADALARGESVKDIAHALGLHISTVYRELERGRNPDTQQYEPDYSEARYRDRFYYKGNSPRLEKDTELADAFSELILNDRLSPEQAIAKLREAGYVDVPSKTTVYSAIDRGLIPGVTRESLRAEMTAVFSGGMVHLPKWVRDELGIGDGDRLSIQVSGGGLLLKKEE